MAADLPGRLTAERCPDCGARLAKVYPGEDPEALPVPGVRIQVELVTEE